MVEKIDGVEERQRWDGREDRGGRRKGKKRVSAEETVGIVGSEW